MVYCEADETVELQIFVHLDFVLIPMWRYYETVETVEPQIFMCLNSVFICRGFVVMQMRELDL